MNLHKNLRCYRMFLSIHLKSSMQYKVSFFLTVIGRFMIAFNAFLAIFFLFSGITNIKGYSYSDVLLCFSVVQMSFTIAECFGSGFMTFTGLVKRGEFDRILLRPCSTILQVLGSKFDLGRITPMLTGVIMLVIGIKKSQIHWTVGTIMTLILMILGGVLLFVGLFMIGAGICFFSIDDPRFIHMLTYGAKEHGKYPLDIYGKGIQRFCTYIIPYTIVQYYPLQYLLGKSEHWQYGLYPLGTIPFYILCYIFWRIGLRNYKSCGS